MIYGSLWRRAHSRWTKPTRHIYVQHIAAERKEPPHHNYVQHIAAERQGYGDSAAALLHGMQHCTTPQITGLECIRREASKIIVWNWDDALLLHDDFT